jgi:heat shock protein HslJ
LGDAAVTATFADGTMAGESGCNSYTTTYKVDGSSLTIGPNIASTQKACDDAPMAVEAAYLAALPKVKEYSIEGTTLTLSGEDGKAVLTFDAVDGAKAIVGSWTVTSYYSGDAITSVAQGSEITAEFSEDGQISGNATCNTYNGPYVIDGTSMKIGPLISTKMACASDELSKQEADYLAALDLTRSYSITGDRLDLLREGGTIAATLQKA